MNKKLKKMFCSTILLSSIFYLSPLAQINAYSESGIRNQWKYESHYAPYAGRNIESWNYYGNDGKPKEGWFTVGGKWYYGNETHDNDFYGIYINEWVASNGNYNYYCGSDGAMKTGWFQARPGNNYDAGFKWYYAGADGKILRNTYTPDGYWVNSSGIYK